ncbi:hypothetical protein QQZ08_002514 [Neonectria magnoliae]|uniref:Uncharacterized protein n=1 Tax=Neonectria magnoliae TaxID=2732573 RepID=A0ABR1IDA8_9HYPO
MSFLRRLLVLGLTALTSAAPPWGRDDIVERDPLEDGPLIDPAATTPFSVPIDYATMPAGTYTESIGRSVVVIVVTGPTSTPAPCPPECDCSWIQDKESEDYFQCITNPDCRFCRV